MCKAIYPHACQSHCLKQASKFEGHRFPRVNDGIVMEYSSRSSKEIGGVENTNALLLSRWALTLDLSDRSLQFPRMGRWYVIPRSCWLVCMYYIQDFDVHTFQWSHFSFLTVLRIVIYRLLLLRAKVVGSYVTTIETCIYRKGWGSLVKA